MMLRGYLNPNPAFKDKPIRNSWGVEYPIGNDPFLEFEFIDFPLGEYRIELLSPFKMEGKILIDKPTVSFYFVDEGFESPEITDVRARITGEGRNREFSLPVDVCKIYGQVKTFEGEKAFAYLWAAREKVVEHEVMARTDKNGKFSIYVPKGRSLRLFVCNRSYAKTILETWVMCDNPVCDVEIHPRIGGNFELYEFKAWEFDGIWNIFFVPAIVDSASPPEIDAKNVKIWVNGVSAVIKSFTPHKVYFPGEKGGDYYPAYIISAVLKGDEDITKPIIVRCLVESDTCKGEAWYIHC